jgi:hypothetical protein
MFQHNSGTPGAISTKLGTRMSICIYTNLSYILYIYIYKYKWRNVFVCMFQYSSGMPGEISTKLGTHMAICIHTNLILYISIYIKMDVCVYVYSSITLEHLEQFQPKLVHI